MENLKSGSQGFLFNSFYVLRDIAFIQRYSMKNDVQGAYCGINGKLQFIRLFQGALKNRSKDVENSGIHCEAEKNQSWHRWRKN